MGLFLGIDTSNYTTSLALTNEKGDVLFDSRKILEVKFGQKGLRQGEAFFQHIKNFPLIFDDVFDKIRKEDIKALAVSTKPRPIHDSYMPVFQAGKSMARIIAKSLGVPLIFTSHQEGHVMAGIWSSGQTFWERFITIHISGGTTEVLEVFLKNNNPIEFDIIKLGGSNDLHAGQFIDRVGVRMGLGFPAGPQLEQLAKKSTNPYVIPIAVKELNLSFSGPESHAQRLLDQGAGFSDVARGVEDSLIKSLEKVIINVYEKTKLNTCLLVGGVASNSYLRITLKKNLTEKIKDLNLLFASPECSSDNAVGVSLIAKSGYNKGGRLKDE